MSETEIQPVSIEVLNQEEISETLEVSKGFETSVKSPSETFFESFVGFVEAVRITGRNKGTISRDTKSGRLPVQVSDTGQKRYKVADLYTVYGLQQPKETKFHEVKKLVETDDKTIGAAVNLAVLNERLRAQEELLRIKDAQIRDLQNSRDKLLEQNNRLTLLLPSPTALEPVKGQSLGKTSWWKKLFS